MGINRMLYPKAYKRVEGRVFVQASSENNAYHMHDRFLDLMVKKKYATQKPKTLNEVCIKNKSAMTHSISLNFNGC